VISRISFVLLIAGVVIFGSCETEILPELPGYEQYFPTDEGRIWEYQLDSIIYRETVPNDTQRWFVREEVGPEYTDLEGVPSFPVMRYRRRNPSENWRYDNTWVIRRWEGRGEYVENNLRFVKLVFPIREGDSWNGHLFFSDLENIPVVESCNNYAFLYDWEYRYTGVHQAGIAGSFSFDSTLTVQQAGEQNLIEFNSAEEHYATGVGLIKRRFDHLTTQNICPECPWSDKAECGFSVIQTLVYWE
jgi:hypothetical protein